MNSNVVGPSGLIASTPLFQSPRSSLNLPARPASINFGPILPTQTNRNGRISSPTRAGPGVSGTSIGGILPTSPRSIGNSIPFSGSSGLPVEPLFNGGSTAGSIPRTPNMFATTYVPGSRTNGVSPSSNMIISGNQQSSRITPVEGYYNISGTDSSQLNQSLGRGRSSSPSAGSIRSPRRSGARSTSPIVSTPPVSPGSYQLNRVVGTGSRSPRSVGIGEAGSRSFPPHQVEKTGSRSFPPHQVEKTGSRSFPPHQVEKTGSGLPQLNSLARSTSPSRIPSSRVENIGTGRGQTSLPRPILLPAAIPLASSAKTSGTSFGSSTSRQSIPMRSLPSSQDSFLLGSSFQLQGEGRSLGSQSPRGSRGTFSTGGIGLVGSQSSIGTYSGIRSPSRSRSPMTSSIGYPVGENGINLSSERKWRHSNLDWFKPTASDRADFMHMVRVYDPVNKMDMLVYFGDTKLFNSVSRSQRQSMLATGYQRTSPGVMVKDDPLTAAFWERRFLLNSGEPYEIHLPEGVTASQLPSEFKFKTTFYA